MNAVTPMPTQANSLMEVIARAASDPNTDVEKMERLMGMYERLKDREAKAEYITALAEMKPKLPVVIRHGKIEIKDKATQTKVIQSTGYGKWEDIDEAITPILAEHGFVITFRCGIVADGKITVTGVLSHRAGHSEETTMTLPHDSTGSKNAVQAVGSSTSYGKRYTATLLLNIRTKGEDDDGEAGGTAFVTDAQIAELRNKIDETGASIESLCRFLKVESLAAIPAKDFTKAIVALEIKAQAKK